MTRLLLDEKPLLVMPSLATKIGLPESIFLQQLHYWLDRSAHTKENHKWIYNSVPEWHKQFPFWSESTIGRLIRKLEKSGLIISGNFNKSAIDKTKWYRINYEMLEEIDNKSNEVRKSTSSGQIDTIDIPNRHDGDTTLTRPIPESTSESTSEINNNDNDSARVLEIVDSEKKESAFTFYEKNGFGILTPHVGEKMGAWIDDLNEELVLHALKISVENGIPRWSYAEKILHDWSNKKFVSVSQIEAFEKQRKQGQATRSPGRSSGRKDILPEWFGKEDNSTPEPVNDPDYEQRKADLIAKLQKMKEEG